MKRIGLFSNRILLAVLMLTLSAPNTVFGAAAEAIPAEPAMETEEEPVIDLIEEDEKTDLSSEGSDDNIGGNSDKTYDVPGQSYKLTYVEKEDGTICITGQTGTLVGEGELLLPDMIDGKPVTEIGDTPAGSGAFQGCIGFTGPLIIPDTVTIIGMNAFSGCRFTSLKLSKNVTDIKNYAFCKCKDLKGELIIPDNVTNIGFYAFSECVGLTKLKIGNNVNKIGNNAFWGCTGLDGVLTIPGNVNRIGPDAFTNCTGFSSLKIEEGVVEIAGHAFSRCSGFKDTLTIPASVLYLAQDCLAQCSGLTKIVNKSSRGVALPYVQGRTWKNLETGETITSIEDGTAVRDDHTEKGSITFNTSGLVVQKGKTNKNVKVYVTDDKIKSVKADNGNVKVVLKGKTLHITGKKNGRSVITVTGKGGSEAELYVTVQKDKVTTGNVKVSKSSLSVRKGKSKTVTVTATPDKISTGENIKITARKTGIVKYKIDQSSGKIRITGKKKGTCKLIVKVGKKSREITVKVK